MGAPKRKTVALAGGHGFPELLTNRDCNLSVEACNKWLTIWRFTRGHLSHKGCEASFKAHPEWRDA